jgi:hypothetical protein
MSPSTEARPRRADKRTAAARGAPALPDADKTRWTDLEKISRSTLVSSGGRRSLVVAGSWSADEPGEHTIDIQFHRPVTLRRLRVVFEETAFGRTQELTVWATLHRGELHKEVIRRTSTFSPAATLVVEDYPCALEQVSAIQLRIVPDIDGRRRRAQIRTLQIVAE